MYKYTASSAGSAGSKAANSECTIVKLIIMQVFYFKREFFSTQ